MRYIETDQDKIKWFVLLLFILSWGSIKISLPALPRLATVFHTNVSNLKLSVTIFFIFYASSQLVWGSLSEHFGRRKMIIAGLMITFIGSVIAMLSRSVDVYIIGRSIEGIGMGSVSPVCRAMLADIFDKKQVANTMGLVSLTIANMPVIAPLIGGYLVVYIGFRAIFALYAALAIGYLIVVIKKLPETIQQTKHRLSIKTIFSDYYHLICHPVFWGYALCYAFLSGFVLGYYAAMPFWFVTHFGMKENHYAYLALFNALAYIAGILISRQLIKSMNIPNLIMLISAFMLVLIPISCFVAYIFNSQIVMIVILMALYTFFAGLIFPNATAGGLTVFRKMAGPTSALMTTIMFLTAALTSWVAANLSVETLWPLAFYICIGTIGCFLSSYLLIWFYRSCE